MCSRLKNSEKSTNLPRRTSGDVQYSLANRTVPEALALGSGVDHFPVFVLSFSQDHHGDGWCVFVRDDSGHGPLLNGCSVMVLPESGCLFQRWSFV